MTGDGQGSGLRMNSLLKYVATTTLTEPDWNATLLSGDAGEAVCKLKETPGGDLLINGSADLFGYLSAKGLIDEYRFMIFPVVVGVGKRLFAEGASTPDLDLIKTQITTSGVAILTYSPAVAAAC
jgi:dihydrofolate reductase